MGKVYGKNASDSTQLIIDGDAIDQRLSTLEANWNSISQVSVTVTPYLSNVPNTSVFDCVAYPALRLCHLEATIPSRGKAYGRGTRFTMANVDENYLPQRNVDLNCSCDGNIIPACGLWTDGQIVFTAKTGTTSATASVTISGTWRY